jgi:hypothetical protein
MRTLRKGIAAGIVVLCFLIGGPGGLHSASGVDNGPLKGAARSVLENYEKIHKALAADSITGVSESAGTIAKAIRDDSGKSLPLTVAADAEKVAEAQDLRAARRAFKPLSASLIGWMAESKLESSGYQEVYCPMADANWLQKGEEIFNPYYGKKMLHCGAIERSF